MGLSRKQSPTTSRVTSSPLSRAFLLYKSTTYDMQKGVVFNSVLLYNKCMKVEKELKMTEFEKNCYGMTEADIREDYMESITARFSGLEMVVMSILSDAQELLAMGRSEQSRKQMNIAKFILSEMMETKRSTVA